MEVHKRRYGDADMLCYTHIIVRRNITKIKMLTTRLRTHFTISKQIISVEVIRISLKYWKVKIIIGIDAMPDALRLLFYCDYDVRFSLVDYEQLITNVTMYVQRICFAIMQFDYLTIWVYACRERACIGEIGCCCSRCRQRLAAFSVLPKIPFELWSNLLFSEFEWMNINYGRGTITTGVIVTNIIMENFKVT